MDDVSNEPVRRSERRRLAALVSVRFSPAEEELIRAVAAKRGLSVSGFVRRAALREAAPAPTTDRRARSGSVTTTSHTFMSHTTGGVTIVGPTPGAIVREVRNV